MASGLTHKKSEMAFVDGAVDPISSSATSAVGMGSAAEPETAAIPTSVMGKIHYHCLRVVGWTRRQMALVRPWTDFFDRNSFSPPSGLAESLSRINRNVNHYYHNYIILALLCSSYVLLLNLSFSICLLLTFMMWWYVSSKRAEAAETNVNHFRIGKYRIFFSRAYLFIFAFGCISFFFLNGSSVVFWLLLSSLGVVAIHAALRQPTVEEQPFSFV